ncbi:MAG: FkbM family methyltransferase [Pseudomonadota bacterium]
MIPVLVINRATDIDRLESFTTSAADLKIEPIRIDAFDAHLRGFPFGLFTDLIGTHFWGEDTIKTGAIGCFLSHRRAWQHVIDMGVEAALICEDDVVLTEDLGRPTSVASTVADLDVLFANDRLGAWAEAAFPGQPVSPVADVVEMLARTGGPKEAGLKPSPGADCYLLTRRGAERLLALTEAQRIVCGVDWALVWNSLNIPNEDLSPAFPELEILHDTSISADQPLNAHVLAKPLSRLNPGPSALQHSIKRKISELTARAAHLAHTEFVATVHLGGAQLCFAGRSGPDPVMEMHRAGHLWDEAGIRLLLERFPSGGTFVDIGAHLGNHTVAIGKLGAARLVLAIEANPEIHKILHANIAMNGLTEEVEVAPEALALGASAGDAWLLLNRRRSSETMVKRDAPDESQKIRIRSVTGDEWLSGRPVDAIKIDTSGTEVDILRGLRKTIEAQKPTILIDHSEGSLERIQRLAGELDMRVSATRPSSRKRRDSSLLIPVSG